ncbi:adenine phosphoribosyltransferase [Sneathiella chungangensis]|uniref:Adenine phosphoribosyltransferase n=1 Tax=Sneathiella chungangensis TaxID=1418234 RepID=A0A845MFE6_9PROT|nr:adenine phosphoribosyltransferase [Sneathiella chungangensis]MZR22589.1 adenine phosphoribosyltransferase [Sneathiella chungangensis]
MDIKTIIRTIPDYPKKGIMFRDITTLWQDAGGFRHVIDQLVWPYAGVRIDKVAGIEARGFVLGGAIAHQLSVGFIPVRKKGKLPAAVISEEYDLEYGTDTVEIHEDAIKKGENILLVDDLIATGGTAAAAINLIRHAGGTVVGAAFVIDLPDIGGARRIGKMGVNVRTLCEFEGD